MGGAVDHGEPASEMDVEAFLGEHSVDEKAPARLRGLHPKLQQLVIKKGSMQDAREQTAVLMKRCSYVMSLKEGDWACPGCYDHQFAKNTACRKCATPNPLLPAA